MKFFKIVWALSLFVMPIYGCAKHNPVPASQDQVTEASPILYADDFGAKADGATDNTSFIQAALDRAAAAGGGIVQLGAGAYAVKGNLEIPQSVTLKGLWETPPNTGSVSWSETQFSNMKLPTLLLAYAGKGNEQTKAFITMNLGAALVGLAVYYPEQIDSETPFPYPYAIQSAASADGVALKNVMLVNPYKGVDFGTNQTQRPFIDGLYGQPLKTGLYIDQNYDVGRVSNVHFWPFWGYGFSAVSKFTQENGEGIIVGRADWQYFDNCFIIGMKTGFRFINSIKPLIGPGNILITGGGADICQTAVLIEGTQSHSGVSFVNSQVYGDVVITSGNEGPVKFTNCGFFGSINGAQSVRYMQLAGNGRISFDNCHFNMISPQAGTAPVSFLLDGLNVSFQNSEFRDGDITSFKLTDKVEAFTLIGNTFKTDVEMIDESGGRAQIIDIGNVFGVGTGAHMLSIDMYIFGSEKATLVNGTDFPNTDPSVWLKDWEVIGNAEQLSVAPLNVLQVNVLKVAPGKEPQYAATGIQRAVSLKPNTEYIISAWIGSEPYGGGTLEINVDLGPESPLRLTAATNQSTSQAGFYYAGFNTKDTGTDVMVRIFYDGKSGQFTGNDVIGWWKNVAITPKADFLPPEKNR